MVFSELIKSFGKTREYMRDFYIYGFKSRTGYSIKSARTYDDEKRRIESWLGKYVLHVKRQFLLQSLIQDLRRLYLRNERSPIGKIHQILWQVYLLYVDSIPKLLSNLSQAY